MCGRVTRTILWPRLFTFVSILIPSGEHLTSRGEHLTSRGEMDVRQVVFKYILRGWRTFSFQNLLNIGDFKSVCLNVGRNDKSSISWYSLR